ncbi:nucleoside deaminase [Thalassobacterium sedimentorum]|nr:nucleoside deaminase [Coraliomargarita sp. SDUM461004]
MHKILMILSSTLLALTIGHSENTQTISERGANSDTTAKQIMALPDDPATTTADRELMSYAYALAERAVEHGNHPFSALLVKDGEIIFEFENAVYTLQDVTQHAETGLISQATRQFDRATLAASTLYASTEPCIMCCGAIRWAGIRKVVYGTTSSKLTEVIRQIYPAAAKNPLPESPLAIREIFQRTEPGVQVYGPLMEAEGIAIHAKYWGEDPVLRSILGNQ